MDEKDYSENFDDENVKLTKKYRKIFLQEKCLFRYRRCYHNQVYNVRCHLLQSQECE